MFDEEAEFERKKAEKIQERMAAYKKVPPVRFVFGRDPRYIDGFVIAVYWKKYPFVPIRLMQIYARHIELWFHFEWRFSSKLKERHSVNKT